MIKTILYREVEGACLGEIGWVVLVTECKDEDIVPGLIEADTGKVAFTVRPASAPGRARPPQEMTRKSPPNRTRSA